jgi:NAD(P)-dependent dehydrogenase (short-subunit alcohol dehydrogenase family)
MPSSWDGVSRAAVSRGRPWRHLFAPTRTLREEIDVQDMKDDVVVVTGAGQGLGRHLALEAGRRGARVVVAHRGKNADAVLKEIEDLGAEAVGHQVDVADYESVVGLAEFVAAKYGHVNVLVNNAARAAGAGPLDTADPADTRAMFEVGILGVFHGIRAFADQLKTAGAAGKHAFILNIGSEHSLGVPPHVSPISTYTVSKYTTLAFTDVARRDFTGTGVSVTLSAPGWIRTEKVDDIVRTSSAAAAAIEPYLQEPELVARLSFDAMLAGRHVVVTNPASREFAAVRLRELTEEIARVPQDAPAEVVHEHDGRGDISKCPVGHLFGSPQT